MLDKIACLVRLTFAVPVAGIIFMVAGMHHNNIAGLAALNPAAAKAGQAMLAALPLPNLCGRPGVASNCIVDADAYATRVRGAVADIVRQQVQSGVDVVTDGEQSKTSFSAYVNERLTGFEPKADTRRTSFVLVVIACSSGPAIGCGQAG